MYFCTTYLSQKSYADPPISLFLLMGKILIFISLNMSSKRSAVSSPTEGNISSVGAAPTTQNEVSPEQPPPAVAQKKKGRKKGMKMELLALQEGGSGARPRVQIEHETCWNMTTTNKFEGGFDDEESNWSSDSEEDVSSVESSDFGVPEEEEESCLTDLVGNRILPVGQVVKAF